MAREIQNIYNCKCYTPDQNLNKTCNKESRCVIYHNEYCNKYKPIKIK